MDQTGPARIGTARRRAARAHAALAAVAAVAATLTASGCATGPPAPSLGGTPFQQATGDRFGWQEQRIEAGRWQLSFQGNARATRTDVENALLLRAAQLTLEQGGSWFALSGRATDEERVRRTIPDAFGPAPGQPVWHPRLGWVWLHDPWFDPWARRGLWGGEVIDISRFRASAELLVGTGARPDGPDVYGAAEVAANLSGLIRSPAPGVSSGRTSP